ncbi:MAG: hypothetical protein AB7N80_13030, partial [Bdellovibrionales bacterium]
ALGLNFRQLSGVSAAAWREGYKRWSESLSKWSYSQLVGLNVNNPKSLVFPRSWQDLVEAHSELKQLGREVDKRRRDGASPDSEALKKIVERLRQQADRAQDLSLYR